MYCVNYCSYSFLSLRANDGTHCQNLLFSLILPSVQFLRTPLRLLLRLSSSHWSDHTNTLTILLRAWEV